MTTGQAVWSLLEILLFALTMACTHLVMSFGQTLMHYRLGHRRLGGFLFRSHINFHHVHYARGHLATTTHKGKGGNVTPYFVIPVFLVVAAVFSLMPRSLFIAVALAAGASFFAHVLFDRAYHTEGSYLERFAWYRRKRQLHFVHHLHANSNFAVIDFFWDRVLGTYRKPDGVVR